MSEKLGRPRASAIRLVIVSGVFFLITGISIGTQSGQVKIQELVSSFLSVSAFLLLRLQDTLRQE